MVDEAKRLQGRGFGRRVGFGRRPALLVVDFSAAFTDPEAPLGAEMGAEIAQANRLILAARAAGAPVFLSTIAYAEPLRDAGIWAEKIEGLRGLRTGSPAVELDPRLERTPGDRLLVKRFASCFFGTTLAGDLHRAAADSLVIAGCTTSGCVRASAVDACQHGLRTLVAREATADRLPEAHRQSLIDIDLKYGDVLPVEELLAGFAALAAAPAADLPRTAAGG
ncbi:Nicotinamidase-related amidase [Tistlia consotensis]|uniref:Nicotinamidase-related amidase n=1 Tax=Tistlia consotensis USBA 355 TaxID=560819 RepID=A0A1Y6C4D4_9PROT|nr:isochorismatase family protein [Tistlia consotensis]SMF36379.1 Nicotinamidase-related amidase [Tistlia consotensis USBA 355]SNR71775.1 Nicotinamidase-related amidase [Tistlia consotensis]